MSDFSEEKYEEIIMGLIVSGGNARSLSIEAIQAAKTGDFVKAQALLAECEEALNEAHNLQTELIQKEVSGQHVQVRLLLVHAQDHLMNAIVVKDMAEEFVDLYRKIQ